MEVPSEEKSPKKKSSKRRRRRRRSRFRRKSTPARNSSVSKITENSELENKGIDEDNEGMDEDNEDGKEVASDNIGEGGVTVVKNGYDDMVCVNGKEPQNNEIDIDSVRTLRFVVLIMSLVY